MISLLEFMALVTSTASITASMEPPDPLTAGIIRDTRYKATFQRDMRRQTLRRLMHQFLACWEQRVSIPRWKKLSRALKKPFKLSVIIPTMNASARLVPLLQYVRPFADEIIVGVDSKTTDDTLQLAAPLADQCFLIENAARHCNGILDQLVGRCSGDWILRLDDDEWPEPGFVQLWQGLLQDAENRGVTHFKMARPHLCRLDVAASDALGVVPKNRVTASEDKDALYWIPDGYFFPDYQLRLFKNSPALLKFPPALPHVNLSVQGKQAKLHTIRLLHLNLAVYPTIDRLAKLRRNIERHQGDWVHPVNEAALLWERFHYRVLPYTSHEEAFDASVRAVIAQSLRYAGTSIEGAR
ncbi:MAG: glycosyltransferase [Vampirovibrionales bacterium]|nr:glycosyltransferase [Vampirovibrionales bacterium]